MKFGLWALWCLILVNSGWAQTGKITVRVDQPGVKISPMLYGLMTEEINHSYDGGLYAELIQNRIFKDDASRPVHWSLIKSDGSDGQIALDEKDPVNAVALGTSLRLDITAAAAGGRVGVANDGYWGIPVWPGTTYHASFYAKAGQGFSGPLTLTIESNDGATVYATTSVPTLTDQWQKYEATLSTQNVPASAGNRFVIGASSKGTIWLNLVSLFPPTYHDRANGNRIDLMQMLADIQPAFLRFPGGNYLEGNTVADRFHWETTVGDLAQRPGHRGPWRYRSSDGLGLLEFLHWCEDLKMEPVLAVYAGYSLRGQHIPAGPQLQPFVQEALDEIEYVTGDASTPFGGQRAKEGHPEPFKLRYVEIGNEDNFDRQGYDDRFTQFFDAIKAKYPQLQCIATAAVHSRQPDVIDDHYYRSARSMERDAGHYDKTPRNGPKIFVGEWATQEGNPTPDLNAALPDAAWLTGLERNSDIVVMSCYAPLLVNVNRGGSQWPTNLIGYDAVGSFGSPSYHAQKMFARNRGDTVLPVRIDAQMPAETDRQQPMPHGAIGVGTWQTAAEFKDVHVVSGGQSLYQSDFSQGRQGWRTRNGTWNVTDGALRETGNVEDCRAIAGDRSWKDYTLSLKARKISGSEGFLVIFHSADNNNQVWLNLGGWSNTHTALERMEDGAKEAIGDGSPVTIETGRWYDIRIELSGSDIKCYLDDKLIIQATDRPMTPPGPLFAAASRDDSTGDIILKVVNVTGVEERVDIHLEGAGNVADKASVETLSGSPNDVNTLAVPRKVFPLESQIDNASTSFAHEFPANSVTVIHLHTTAK